MEIAKNLSISATFRNQQGPPNWDSTLFAKIVFLDRTHPSAYPQLYQLADTAFTEVSPELLKNYSFFSQEAFVPLGDVVSIDKKNKRITLSNKNIVSYNHLVIVSGTKVNHSSADPQFAPGLHALVDALRVQTKIPHGDSTCTDSASKYHQGAPLQKSHPEIDKLIHPYILLPNEKSPDTPSDLNAHNGRLYEVQL